MDHIREQLQESLEDYTLKTDDEIIDMICQFGCGETKFHTADVERIIREKHFLQEKIEGLIERINQLTSSTNRTFKVCARSVYNGRQGKKRIYKSYEDFKRYSPDIIKRYSRWANVESYELINDEWHLLETTPKQN